MTVENRILIRNTLCTSNSMTEKAHRQDYAVKDQSQDPLGPLGHTRTTCYECTHTAHLFFLSFFLSLCDPPHLPVYMMHVSFISRNNLSSKWKYWRIDWPRRLAVVITKVTHQLLCWYLDVTSHLAFSALAVSIVRKRYRSTDELFFSFVRLQCPFAWYFCVQSGERISLADVWAMTLTNLLDRWMVASNAVTFSTPEKERVPATEDKLEERENTTHTDTRTQVARGGNEHWKKKEKRRRKRKESQRERERESMNTCSGQWKKCAIHTEIDEKKSRERQVNYSCK